MPDMEQLPQDCEATVLEMVDALKDAPVAKIAYLQGVLAGMKAMEALIK